MCAATRASLYLSRRGTPRHFLVSSHPSSRRPSPARSALGPSRGAADATRKARSIGPRRHAVSESPTAVATDAQRRGDGARDRRRRQSVAPHHADGPVLDRHAKRGAARDLIGARSMCESRAHWSERSPASKRSRLASRDINVISSSAENNHVDPRDCSTCTS
jgi:hypothetical protein